MNLHLQCHVCGNRTADVHKKTFESQEGTTGTLYLECHTCGIYPVEAPSTEEKVAANVSNTEETLKTLGESRAARLRRNRFLRSVWEVPYASWAENARMVELENSLEEGALMFIEECSRFMEAENIMALSLWAEEMSGQLQEYGILVRTHLHMVQALSFVTGVDVPPNVLHGGFLKDAAEETATTVPDVVPDVAAETTAEEQEQQIAALFQELLSELSNDKPEEA